MSDILDSLMAGSHEEHVTLDFYDDRDERNSDDLFDYPDEDSPPGSPGESLSQTSEFDPMSSQSEDDDPYPDVGDKIRAVNFWRNTKTRAHVPWATMVTRFRKLAGRSETLLYRWESKYVTDPQNKRMRMQRINREVRIRFEVSRDNGIPVHEIDLQRWALEENNKSADTRIEGFKASRGWIRNFKINNRIVDRKIVNFVSRVNMESVTDKMTAANDCVRRVRELHLDLHQFDENEIWNTDQSPFHKEMHKLRTLEFKGTQSVTGRVQSTGAMTHSYTIQPTVSMDGTLMTPLFIVLQEDGGEFGPIVREKMFKHPEIHPVASSSGKVNNKLIDVWFQDVYFKNAKPDSMLLVDSLNMYNATRIETVKPDGMTVNLQVIPAGTTGMIQPLDVGCFRSMKAFVRRISDHVLVESIEFSLFQRDNILKMWTLVHNQFRSPRFKSFLRYAWHKAGFTDIRLPFESPVEFCFDKGIESCSEPVCGHYRLLKCGWCKRDLCFDHFLGSSFHFCENHIE